MAPPGGPWVLSSQSSREHWTTAFLSELGQLQIEMSNLKI